MSSLTTQERATLQRENTRLHAITSEQESQIRTLRSELVRAQAEIREIKLRYRKRAKK